MEIQITKVHHTFQIRKKLQILHLFTKQTLQNIATLIATLMSRKHPGWARESCDPAVQFCSFTAFLPKQSARFLFLSTFLCFSTNRSNYHEPHISERHGRRIHAAVFLAERNSARCSKLKSEIGREMKIRLPADRQTDGHSLNLDKLSSLWRFFMQGDS